MGNNNKLSGIVGFIFNTRGLKKRDFGIDFIKSIAALFVLYVSMSCFNHAVFELCMECD